MSAFLLSLGIIFVAELGDKSQLMALAFATRYRALPILVGITIATAVVHAVSVVIGTVLDVALPTRAISVVAGLAFFAFAAWTLRGDTLGEDEAGRVERSTGSAVVAAAVAFFLAELGDKTMLATITLATQEGRPASGPGQRSGWSPPTPLPSSPASSSVPGSRNGSSRWPPPPRSSSSACSWSSKASADAPPGWNGTGGGRPVPTRTVRSGRDLVVVAAVARPGVVITATAGTGIVVVATAGT